MAFLHPLPHQILVSIPDCISNYNKNTQYSNPSHYYFPVNSSPIRLTIGKQRSHRHSARVRVSICSGTRAGGDPFSVLLRRIALSSVVFISIGLRVCVYKAAAGSVPMNLANPHALVQQQSLQENEAINSVATIENFDDEELKAAFEKWKSKTYPLTVPFRVVALHGSIPPSWITDFIQSQGKRVKLRSEIRGSLADIFSDLSTNLSKGTFDPKSVAAADIVTIDDSWLSFAIKTNLFEPIPGVEDQDWFKGLSDKWKVYLRRNSHGNLDPEGYTWAAPYRWGSMVIAYKKNKFKMHNLAPIEDWDDLWRPELAGKISMVDSPREIIGAVLKSMGELYNTTDIDAQVNGGRESVQKKLAHLQKQVRLFDSGSYLKAFGVGDVWVAVGWSSDVIPAAKRMSDVSVIVPKSGASLWADLWAIPATSKINTESIGGRVRGPSPLIHQWIEFCLQAARALPFKQEIIPGASPSSLYGPSIEEPKELTNGKPKLDTNLIDGVPPADILNKCEFLEPLSDIAFTDYQLLVAGMQKDRYGLVERMSLLFFSILQFQWRKNESKGNLK